MVHGDHDLVKHGTNLPDYLQCEEKSGNLVQKTFNFGVLDWSRIEKWKSNTKTNNPLLQTGSARLSPSVNNKISQSDQQSSNGFLSSSLSRKFSFSLEKISKSFTLKTNKTYKHLMSGLITHNSSPDSHIFNLISSRIDPSCDKKAIYEKKKDSSNAKAILKLTMKNDIPSFKIVVDNSRDMLTAAVKSLPSGKDDSSLTYTFCSVHDTSKKNGVWKKHDPAEKDSGFGYNIVGNMKISSSYHAEFSGLERDLFVVRESVLYGPDFTQSDCVKSVELAAIIVKNTSKENNGGLGGSKSTVVILPGGNHSLPDNGQPTALIERWRSGGSCDCGGWDVGCELGILTNHNEMTENSNPSTSDRLDLCYQGRHSDKNAFSLAALENAFYSVEYNASSMSCLQAFSICVAVISSLKLTHIFQVNHLQDANDFIKPIIARHRKVKSQTIVHSPVSSV